MTHDLLTLIAIMLMAALLIALIIVGAVIVVPAIRYVSEFALLIWYLIMSA
jgi:hypothetical protein